MRNFAAILLLADGVPMILGGDEIGRSQGGNNNAYCQDNEISWMNWGAVEENASLHRFFRLMIAFRRQHPLLRSTSYGSLAGEGMRRVEWHGTRLHQADWSHESRSIALHLSGLSESGFECHIFFVANAHWEAHEFELPRIGWEWLRFVDTTQTGDDAIAELGYEWPLTSSASYMVGPRSTVVLIARGEKL